MSTTYEKYPTFKTCQMCGAEWRSMESFLADPHLYFNGYQANFDDLDEGIFFFTHDIEPCGSTMGLKVRTFDSLYSGIQHKENKRFSKECPLYCSEHNNLDRCSAHCKNAFVREISQIIKDRHTTAKDIFTTEMGTSTALYDRK